VSTATLRGKTCLVTGASSGIGLETALGLAARGATVILHGRNPARLGQALQRISAAAPGAAASTLACDLEDFTQVRAAARELHARLPHLDVLVNNAGGYFNTRHPVEGGVERTFLGNHLGPFLLTNLLLDLLRAAPAARIVNVSSEAHRQDTLDFDDLGFSRGYFGMRAYARSKLANVLFTYELARRLQGQPVTVTAVHPGHVATDIWRTNFGVVGPALKWLMGLVALTPAQGADPVIWLASAEELQGVTGRYYSRREPVDSSPRSLDEGAALRLWALSERLTGLTSSPAR
jgi:NAD(P)-dependent dehydrogenase (short-subunit alcohol dehydrogenase family)